MKTAYAALLLAFVFLNDGGLAPGQDMEGRSVQDILTKLQDRKTNAAAKVELVKGLAELGPAADPAIDVLLDPDFYLGHVRKNPALKKAVGETLAKIGEPSVQAVLDFTRSAPVREKKGKDATSKEDAKKNRKHDKRIEAQKKAMREEVNSLLRMLADGGLRSEVITALEKDLLNSKKINSSHFEVIALMGPEAVPAMKRVMKKHRKYYANIIGPDPEAVASINATIPEHYTPEAWNDSNRAKQVKFRFRDMCYARPEQKHISALLDPVKDDRILRGDFHEAERLTGMMLSCYGEMAAQPLADLLSDANPRTRRIAASILAMIGPDMKAALPVLEKTFNNKDERIDVRIAAARAIASIKGTDAAKLYGGILDVQDQIVALTRQQQKGNQNKDLWEKHIASDSEKTIARHISLYNKTKEWEKPLYLLSVNREAKAQNQLLREITGKILADPSLASDGLVGSISDTEAHHFVLLFGSKSRFYPGRLEADVEKLLKEFCFTVLDRTKTFEMAFLTKPGKDKRYSIKTVEYFMMQLAKEKTAPILEMSNGPMRYEANQHLCLQILKDDPEFAGRKFKNGDTVSERYKLSAEVLARGMKGLALHGMWTELGSTNYEHKTYRGLLALAEFATDPVVSKRAKMFMDLAFVELEQISISGLRGGSKSRCKDSGVSGRFNRYLAMFHGEHHGNLLEPPGFKPYQPPVPAILLRKMGPTEPVYEIFNRHAKEKETLQARQLNYAYCTPDYVTGCAMYDIRRWEGSGKNRALPYGTMGRWSGVIFRNSAAIELQAYTGEKYNVQSKDVMIAQIYRGARYSGKPQIDFVSINTMVEKDGWTFIENQQAYAAVRPARGGHYWKEPARRRMYLNDNFSPIIIQTGRRTVYGSFENFQEAILSAPLKVTEDLLDYTGPNSPRIEFFLCKDSDEDPYPKRLPKIDGKELDLNLKHNYKSPYINNTVGSNVVTITYGNRAWEYDFDKNEVREVKR